MRAWAIVLVVAGLAASVARAQPVDRREAAAPFPILTVTGTGEVRAAPDRATVRVGAVAQRPDAAAAQDEVNKTVSACIDRIKALGIKPEKIRTVGLSLMPVYSQPQPQPAGKAGFEPRIIGFRAGNTLLVETDDLSLLGKIIDACVASGTNQIEGVTFSLKDDTGQRKTALGDAVKQARQKADAMAAALGENVGPVWRISEGVSQRIVPQMEFAARAAIAAPTPVQPGQVSIGATVTIEYRLGGGR